MTLGTLLPFQNEGVQLVRSMKRHILNYPTGAGKTRTAIEAARSVGAETILIVCPAMVRRNWLRELDKWWPGHPDVGMIAVGRERKLSKPKAAERDRAYAAPVRIVSWALLSECIDKYDFIIFDECHYLKSPKSQQFQHAMHLMQRNPNAYAVGLSATIMPDTPLDVFGPVHILWPTRFGKMTKMDIPWAFKFRYMNVTHNGYGYVAKGAHPIHRYELALRLKHMVHHVNRKEIDHLFPPCRIVPQYVEPGGVKNFKLLKDEFKSDGKSLHMDKVERLLHRAAGLKLPLLGDWLADNRDADHICVIVYHKDLQEEVAAHLRKDKEYQVYVVNGDQQTEERHKIIDAAKAAKKSILVATMSSINIGIDLTYVHRVLILELHYRPETIIQLFGRFNRMNSQHSTLINVLILERTLDEIIAEKLQQKIDDIQTASNKDAAMERVVDGLTKQQTEEEEMIAFEDMVQSFVGDLY